MARLSQMYPTARRVAPIFLPEALRQGLESRRIFRSRGLQAGSLIASRRAFLSGLHLVPPSVDLRRGLVLDIGANEGNFSAAVLSLAPTARIIAAEPNPGPRARLERRLGDRVTVLPVAVGREQGTATFHITGSDHNSSLRVPRSEEMRLAGWEVVDHMPVELTTLDALAGEEELSVVKIDVQGAEMDVLHGGRAALARTGAVLMEITFFSHYEADATFGPLHAEMTAQGFELVGVSEPARTVPEGVSSWADACYARSGR